MCVPVSVGFGAYGACVAFGASLFWLQGQEVVGLHLDLLHHALGGRNTDGVVLQQVAQAVAVDQVDGRRAVTLGFGAGGVSERPRRDEQTFSPRPAIAPRKSRTAEAPTLPLYRLH